MVVGLGRNMLFTVLFWLYSVSEVIDELNDVEVDLDLISALRKEMRKICNLYVLLYYLLQNSL